MFQARKELAVTEILPSRELMQLSDIYREEDINNFYPALKGV